MDSDGNMFKIHCRRKNNGVHTVNQGKEKTITEEFAKMYF